MRIGEKDPAKLLNSGFVFLTVVSMLYNFGIQMITSILSVYADSLGATAMQIGMLSGAFAYTSIVLRFIAGPVIDAFKQKRTMIISMALVAAAYLGFSLSGSYGALFAFRMLQGIGQVFGNACCLAMVSQVIPREKFSVGVGYFSCSQVVSQAIGPSMALKFAEWFGYRGAFIAAAVLVVLAIVLLLTVKLPPREVKKFNLNPKNLLAREAFLPAALLLFAGMAFQAIASLLIVYAKQRGIGSEIGIFFTVYAVMMLVTRPIVGKLVDKFGFAKVGIPAFVLTAVSLVLISFADKLWIFLVAACVNSLGYGGVQPALQALCMQAVPMHRRGAASSTSYFGIDGATIVGPLIAGALVDVVGYQMMWRWMCVPVIVGCVIIFLGRKRLREIETTFLE